MTRVLVIDDEEIIRYVFQRFLTDAGCEVVLAAQVDDARDRLSDNEFDVVLVDRFLSGDQNGLDFVKEIRIIQPSCEIIVISGLPMAKAMSDSTEGKPFAFLAKPVRREDLIRVVEEAAEKTKEKRSA